MYRNLSAKYYQENKEKLQKKADERCQILSKEEKKQYGCERYKNLSKEKKQKLLEYRKKYYRMGKKFIL